MKIKSYFAGTIREAIDRAREELGPDAMIIASRKTEGDNRSRGDYEVVCGVMGEQPADSKVRKAGTVPVSSSLPESRTELRNPPRQEAGPEMRGLPRAETRPAPRSSLFEGVGTDIVSEWFQKLKNVGRKRASEPNRIEAEIRSRLAVAPELGRAGCTRKVVALVGPPGAGKTTTLTKLAVRYGLTARRPMHLISMDGYRVAGTDGLRAYAGAMGVGFDALETATSLAQTLEQHSGKGLILIDTPGLGPSDLPGATALASLLSRSREIDVHLVLPATMSATDMNATFLRFRPWLPQKLLFTGVDMAATLSPAISLAMEIETPISFLANGQQIPEDLREANVEELIRRVIPESGMKSAISAA